MDYISKATPSPDKLAWMQAHAPSTPGECLDLGCGAGLYADWLTRRGWKVTAMDRCPAAGINAAATMTHDLEIGLPLADARFDLVLAWDILEHVQAEESLWREIARVLRPGGVLLGSVPHGDDERLRRYNLVFKHRLDHTHVRDYFPPTIGEKCHAAGLKAVAIELRGPVPPHIFVEFIPLPILRKPVGLLIGLARRLGFLRFDELYADIFWAALKARQG